MTKGLRVGNTKKIIISLASNPSLTTFYVEKLSPFSATFNVKPNNGGMKHQPRREKSHNDCSARKMI